MDAPRVRIAPSPTGFFHVGSARTALFNWLFARRYGGTFVVRIEDTDAERNREEWVDVIVAALEWLGLPPDEPPVRQSQFAAAHDAAATLLFESGALYGCDCTRAAIDERLANLPQTGYDGYCRDRALARGPGVALRFRVPDRGETIVHDVIRGDVVFQNASIEDFVVVRSNGAALFALSNLVDDRAMGITHVVRGDEHLANTPKQLLLAAALDAAEGAEPSARRSRSAGTPSPSSSIETRASSHPRCSTSSGSSGGAPAATTRWSISTRWSSGSRSRT